MDTTHQRTERHIEAGSEGPRTQQFDEQGDPISYLFLAEISSRIFPFIASQPDDSHEKAWQTLVFASVSHRWREIATSEPQLWTSISLTLDSAPTPLPHPDTLKEFIRRSGHPPLSVHIRSVFKLEEEPTVALFPPRGLSVTFSAIV